MKNNNLFAALHAAFPADLDRTAIETADGPGAPLYYRWRDLERGTGHAGQPAAVAGPAAGARIAVQTEKSVEALMLYLAVLRAGYVYLPLNTAYQAGEIEYFIGTLSPAWWCARAGTSAGSASWPSRPARGTSSRSTTTAAAACSTAPR